jgi:hypothetical protein
MMQELVDNETHGSNDSTVSGVFGTPSEDGSSSTGNHKGSTENKREEEAIAHAENRAVFQIRLLVIIILVSLTVGVAFLVFFYTRRDEIESFETAFHEDSEKIFE